MSASPENAANGAAAAAAPASGGDPSGFLNEILHGPVTVKLNSGVIYKGASGPKSVILGAKFRS